MDHIAAPLRALAVPTADLTLDPQNARKHSARNLDAIERSLTRFGFLEPIVVQRQGMIVRAGNGRVQVARRLGWTHVPAVVVDQDDVEAAAFALADNRTAELAEWDDANLAAVLSVVGDDTELLVATGFNDDEALALMADTQLVEPTVTELSEVVAERADELPTEVPVITARGDVITLGAHELHCTDCMALLRSLPDNSVDAIVTDPPYGLSPDGRARTWDEIQALRADGKGPRAGFMGRAWDAGVPGIEWARECLRVLKPGGHLVAFSATRTYHRLAVAIEDAGFEIRDMIAWLQWQGFPKSHDVSKAIDKHHGATRRVVGQDTKARSSSGASALPTLDGRVEYKTWDITEPATDDARTWAGWGTGLKPSMEPHVLARKPLEPGLTIAENVLKWGTGALNIDGARITAGDSAWPGPNDAVQPSYMPAPNRVLGQFGSHAGEPWEPSTLGRWPANIYACPKPARSEREAGTDELPTEDGYQITGRKQGSAGSNHARAGRTAHDVRNVHPTVKPIKLMRWLITLVTPPGGTVLEPFAGSGTTLLAAGADCRVVASEQDPRYCDIIRARVTHGLSV